MTLFSDAQKNIQMKRGDTGQINISGIPTDKSYTCYLSIYNEDSNTIITEIPLSNYNQTAGTGQIVFSREISDTLPVGEWVYGFKICADGSEDTVIPMTRVENGVIVNYSAPRFTVDYKYVEGE